MGKHKSKDHKHKKKSEKKEKRHKKEKRRHRSRSSDSGTGSSSGDDAPPRAVDVNTQLAMGRAAGRAIREIMAYKYELRGEIRQLARHLDGDNALDVSGVADGFLKSRLRSLFDNLLQLRKTSAGHYLRLPGSSTVISFVAPFLEETPASLASYAGAAAAAAVAEKRAAAVCEVEGASQGARQPASAVTEPEAERGAGVAAAAPVSPVGPLLTTSISAAHQKEAPTEDAQMEPPRRVLGPAVPPPEILAAAAAMEAPEDEENGVGGAAFYYLEDFVVGPPPPEVQEEVDHASMDDRSREVARVVAVLRQHEAEGAQQLAAPTAAGAAPAPLPPDAYSILGVDNTAAPTGELKRRYWKLSLLIHPDKCRHPQAEEAFQAVAVAAKQLQDAEGRAAVDGAREKKEFQREAAEFAAHQERERQWRIARSEGTAEDLKGPMPVGPAQRDSWMTDLPPEKSGPTGPPRASVKAFSAAGITQRGDTSAWTTTPQERAAGGSGKLLEGGKALQLTAHADPGKTAAVVDAYNSTTRGKSLLEKHLEKQQKKGGGGKKEGKKKKRKAEELGAGGGGASAGGGGKEEEDWDRTAHPWRPFDREKDMEGKSSGAADPHKLLQNMKGLSSKFAGNSAGGRAFL